MIEVHSAKPQMNYGRLFWVNRESKWRVVYTSNDKYFAHIPSAIFAVKAD